MTDTFPTQGFAELTPHHCLTAFPFTLLHPSSSSSFLPDSSDSHEVEKHTQNHSLWQRLMRKRQVFISLVTQTLTAQSKRGYTKLYGVLFDLELEGFILFSLKTAQAELASHAQKNVGRSRLQDTRKWRSNDGTCSASAVSHGKAQHVGGQRNCFSPWDGAMALTTASPFHAEFHRRKTELLWPQRLLHSEFIPDHKICRKTITFNDTVIYCPCLYLPKIFWKSYLEEVHYVHHYC